MGVVLGPLRQVAQGVDDVDRAVAFYRDVLGLPLIARFGDLAFLDLGGVRLLLERTGGGACSPLYLAVPDIAAAHRALRQQDVVFEQGPQAIFTDVGGTFGPAGEAEWLAFFRDPEGNLLALSSRQPPPPAAEG
jgi:methylmalonyl-CoA/ethylmalonyl-CoA epimerase